MILRFLADTTERDLVILLKAGDQPAFEELYYRYKYRMLANLLKFVKIDALAEDMLQDLFIRVWDSKHFLDAEKSFKSYLFRIAENMVIDFFRKASLDKKFRAYVIANSPIFYSNIDDTIELKEKKQLLNQALQILPAQCRLVFTLCKIEGRTYEEVSDLLQISTHTISNHLVKANKLIRNHTVTIKDLAFIIILFHLQLL